MAQTGGGSGGDGGDVYLAGPAGWIFTALIYLVASVFFRLYVKPVVSVLRGGNYVKADDWLVVLLSLAVAGLFLAKHENAACAPRWTGRTTSPAGSRRPHHAEKSASCCPHQSRQKRAGQVALRQELENAAKREAQREKPSRGY